MWIVAKFLARAAVSPLSHGSMLLVAHVGGTADGTLPTVVTISLGILPVDMMKSRRQKEELQLIFSGTCKDTDACSPLSSCPGDLFDVASMQFALHYMGQTEKRLRHFLHEVSRCLRIGGMFVATTMDSRVLLQLLMGHAEPTWVSAV